jgi:catechol 2,3-dioxygenase-like lactoylglutathione lyase family enzyme
MKIEGLSHVTFVVEDLERMAIFLCEGLGAEEVYDSKAKNYSVSREKFFVLGRVWIVAMQGNSLKERSYRHLAFKIDEKDIKDYEIRLKAIGVEIIPSRKRVDGEGRSLYFYDFDNHLFELHTGTLEQRLERYSK